VALNLAGEDAADVVHLPRPAPTHPLIRPSRRYSPCSAQWARQPTRRNQLSGVWRRRRHPGTAAGRTSSPGQCFGPPTGQVPRSIERSSSAGRRPAIGQAAKHRG
jgi:hypothetical protein